MNNNNFLILFLITINFTLIAQNRKWNYSIEFNNNSSLVNRQHFSSFISFSPLNQKSVQFERTSIIDYGFRVGIHRKINENTWLGLLYGDNFQRVDYINTEGLYPDNYYEQIRRHYLISFRYQFNYINKLPIDFFFNIGYNNPLFNDYTHYYESDPGSNQGGKVEYLSEEIKRQPLIQLQAQIPVKFSDRVDLFFSFNTQLSEIYKGDDIVLGFTNRLGIGFWFE